MRIYFSGWGADDRPAGLSRRPSFMLTYFDLNKGAKVPTRILHRHLKHRKKEDVFIDSGAWSLYKLHVLKAVKKAQVPRRFRIDRGERRTKFSGLIDEKSLKKTTVLREGEFLDQPMVSVGQGDFLWYNLKKGSDFRKYCDAYADFIRDYSQRGVRWFANVDVIGNPELTWESQKYFEEQHGVTPVPVVHFGTDLKYLDRYLEKEYKMIGLGGFARRPDKRLVVKWCDEVFIRLCPRSNNRMPITRVHGFAMTSWHLMRRWPWYSVDSTSWLMYGTYGLICVPYPDEEGGFRLDRPPAIVSVSHRGRPIDYQNRMHISQIHSDTNEIRKNTKLWLDYLGLKLGSVDKEGNMIEPGVSSSNEIRTSANLRYFMDLEASLPKWPAPLSEKIGLNVAEHHRGFELVF